MIIPSFGLTAPERVLPKLALDFTTAALDSRITFTRTTGASNPATYVNSSGYVTAATNNQPRFDFDFSTGLCLGLLVEEARTNFYLNSQQMNLQTPIGITVATDVAGVPAPDGTITADKLQEDASNGQHAASASFGGAIGDYSFSGFFKAAERTSIRLNMFSTTLNAVAIFNLSTGTITLVSGGATNAKITKLANGWFRCEMTANQPDVRTLGARFALISGETSHSYVGTPGYGAYAWGAQLEVGAFPTSYIPTTATALTRNADVAVMTGTNFSDWFNASEGSAVIQVLPSTISGTRPAVEFDDNTVNEVIVLRGVAADPQLYVVDGGAAQATLDAGSITANTAYKLGGAWKASSFAASVNGGGSVSQLSGTYPTVTQARLGSDGTNYLNGYLQNLRYWSQRVTNAETQAFSK